MPYISVREKKAYVCPIGFCPAQEMDIFLILYGDWNLTPFGIQVLNLVKLSQPEIALEWFILLSCSGAL
jgi:hypothetical protein